MIKRFYNYVFGSPLRNRVALFSLMLTLTPIFLLGSLSLYFISISHHYDVHRMEEGLLSQKIEEIKKSFADTLGVIDLQVAFTQKSQIRLDDQEFLLENIIANNRAFTRVSFIDLRGMETQKIYASGAKTPLVDVSLLPEFTEPMLGKRYMSDVYYTEKGPAMTIAAPVHNHNGDTVQILSADIDLTPLLSNFEGIELGSAGYMLVFDRQGNVIAPTRSGIFQRNFASAERVQSVLRGGESTGLDAHDIYHGYLDGTPVIGAAKHDPTTGWALLVEWPIADADDIIGDVRNQIFEVTLASVLVILLVVPLLGNRLVQPIRLLARGAEKIGKGDFDGAISIKTNDELEELGNRFNEMAKGLKRLQELRNEFVYIVTHELRTPITAIRGYLEIFYDEGKGKVEPKLWELIEPVKQSSNHLNQLVNDLLDVASSEAGHLSLEIKDFVAEPVIASVVHELAAIAREKQSALTFVAPAESHTLKADELRFKQILNNLVSNAIKYGKQGGAVNITLEVKGGLLVTSVKDDGIGIPVDEQQKMFQKFYRVKSSSSKAKGTGLGLFITKDLVEKMGGTIWFTSEEGKGTVFSFSLPLA